MISDTPDLTKASLNSPEADTLGGYLQTARLQQNLSLTQVSDITKYHVNQLVAIEEHQWDKLPTGFVLRSIVRKFAAAVGADSEVALEKLVAATGNVIPVTNKNLKLSMALKVNEQLDEDITSGGSTWLWIILIILVLVVVIYIAISQGMFNLDDVELFKKWSGNNNV